MGEIVENMRGTILEPNVETSWKLAFANQPTKYPFVNKPVEIELFLLDENNEVVKHNNTDFCLDVDLQLLIYPTLNIVESTINNGKVLKLAEKVKIRASGTTTFEFSLTELSSQHSNHDFCLRARISESTVFPILNKSDHLVESCKSVSETISKPFRVVTSRLIINNLVQIPEIWYKDQGGRENCIEIRVMVSPALSEKVPLTAKLVYEDGSEVYDPKGTLYTQHRDSVLEISKKNQAARIKFRIENVSKNHQSKAFCLKIEPSDAQQHADISPVLSSPITVKSKPNTRKKRRKNTNANKRQKLQTPQFLENIGESPILSAVKNLKSFKANNENTSIGVVSTWCESIKDTLCELSELSQRRNAIELKLWSLLSTYPDVLKSLQTVSGESQSNSPKFGGDIERINSMNSLPSLSFSTQQLFKGLSSEVLLTGGNNVGMMLQDLKSFANKQNEKRTSEISSEQSVGQDTTSSKLFQQLIKEYKSMK